jgi:hypothetical protein
MNHEIIDFLSDLKSDSLKYYSHATMFQPTGKYMIEGEKYDEFMDMYCHQIDKHKQNFMFGMTEKKRDDCLPILIDVDITFYYDGKIVGSTARKITPGKPKYLNDSQPGYVFNLDHQNYNRKYVLVMEGQFDAIAVDGVAIGHNDPNEAQCARINALGKEVIVVPDHDKPGAKLIKSAIEHNWGVSIPAWGNGVKDTADAIKLYGRLYTLATILHYKETNEIKIQLLKKKLESLDE